MRPNKRSYLIAAILVALVACGAIGVTLASSEGPSAPSREAYEAGDRATPLPAPTSAQTSTFSILGRARDAADEIPAEAAAQVQASGTFKGLFGANVDLARKARGFASGVAWVVPGRGSVCVLAGSAVDTTGAPEAGMPGGGSCAQESSASEGKLYVISGSIRAPGKQFIAGVVPDGVNQVALEVSGGTTTSLPVHENVFMALVSGHISSVAFDSPNGAVDLEHVGP